jgi:hypothetical protein
LLGKVKQLTQLTSLQHTAHTDMAVSCVAQHKHTY